MNKAFEQTVFSLNSFSLIEIKNKSLSVYQESNLRTRKWVAKKVDERQTDVNKKKENK